MLKVITAHSYWVFGVTLGYTCLQAAINKNILIYRESVKRDLVVKIDQGRFLPAEM